MVFTFTLSSPAVGNVTINFSVGGTATFNTDYTSSGASSFSGSSGSLVILSGTTSRSVTVTPIGDTSLEIQESIILTITSGTGYDGESEYCHSPNKQPRYEFLTAIGGYYGYQSS